MKCSPLSLIALLGASGAWGGCAYYNAMWSAERYAKDARRLEARGQQGEARSQWALAAEKAEAVAQRHPRSKWADDALVLQAEGLARSGSCEVAEAPIARARVTVRDAALQERVRLAEAQCAIAASRPVQAEAALKDVLQSRDRSRRSRAEFLAGEAAALRLNFATAADHFGRSRETAAVPARARALLSGGRADEGAAVIDSLDDPTLFPIERAELLGQLAAVGGPPLASATLDRLLGHARLSFTEQAQLLIADGDRRLAHGDYAEAEARYRRAALVAPVGSPEAGTASIRVPSVLVARATQREDVAPVIADLARVTRSESGPSPARRLLDLLRVATSPGATPGARFRAAELARDSLAAPLLAGRLFLEFAAADTASLFAPKALVAALALLPDRRDSIAAVLDTRYAASPYTRAFHGEANVAYAAAEDSLARELGVEVARAGLPSTGGLRVDAPVPGPRGPRLDDVDARPAARTPGPPRPPGARPVPVRDRPALPERP